MAKQPQAPITTIALTYGEPAGIGPDLVIQLAAQIEKYEHINFVVIGDKDVLHERALQLGYDIIFEGYTKNHHNKQPIQVLHVPTITNTTAGVLNKENSAHVLKCLDVAIKGCLDKTFAALVTGPIHKGIINEAGVAFTGHTEYLADKSDTHKVVMMLCENRSEFNLRVALVTTHLPLSKVSEAITTTELENTINILQHDLVHYFKIPSPSIYVCGLNPHAGEDGHLGNEEQETIEPCLNKLRSQGLNLTGPLPADTLFIPENLKKADAVVAMYHDQGLPMLKHLGFGQAINVTLGLPFIRTSVDHGTALELAGTGQANTDSLFNAIELAYKLAHESAHESSQQMSIA